MQYHITFKCSLECFEDATLVQPAVAVDELILVLCVFLLKYFTDNVSDCCAKVMAEITTIQ